MRENHEMINLSVELEEVLANNKVNLDELQEIEEMIAPACGCGCATGGICW